MLVDFDWVSPEFIEELRREFKEFGEQQNQIEGITCNYNNIGEIFKVQIEVWVRYLYSEADRKRYFQDNHLLNAKFIEILTKYQAKTSYRLMSYQLSKSTNFKLDDITE